MAINKVVYGGQTLIDLTNDTVTADTLLSGATAHAMDGTQITGAVVTAPIDDTLTQEGEAADAKAVGDALATKVDTVNGKGLSENDFTTTLKNKLDGIETGATKVLIDTGLNTTGKAADSKSVGDALAGKVDIVSGKGLSTNDFTTALKNKLDGIAVGATAVTIDSTLATTGQAADAKATGDAIAALQASITALQSTINNLNALLFVE